jgi:hypothetical protein
VFTALNRLPTVMLTQCGRQVLEEFNSVRVRRIVFVNFRQKSAMQFVIVSLEYMTDRA